MAKNLLPYGRQWNDEDDIQAVAQALRGDYLTTGPLIAEFESAFAAQVGATHAVACCNGTAALHLAAMAAEIGPGDWSIVPSLTFLATANATRYCAGDVWFCDVQSNSGLMHEQDLNDAITKAGQRKLKAVFPVHVNGHMVDMEAVGSQARQQGLWVIEDACHGLGTQFTTRDGSSSQVGDCRFSDMTVFSLHPVKTMTSGEGGMITTNSAELAARMRGLRNHGMTRDPQYFTNSSDALDMQGEVNPWYYEMHDLGYNFRITDFQCALGLSQLNKLEMFFKRRRELKALYDNQLSMFGELLKPVAETAGVDPVLHLFAVLIDYSTIGLDRAKFMARLGEEGIGSQVHYYPVHQQPYYRNLYGDIDLPGARDYYDHVLSLPFFPGMGDRDVKYVVQVLDRLIADS